MDELIAGLAEEFHAQLGYIDRMYKGKQRAVALVVQLDAIEAVARNISQNFDRWEYDELMDLFVDKDRE